MQRIALIQNLAASAASDTTLNDRLRCCPFLFIPVRTGGDSFGDAALNCAMGMFGYLVEPEDISVDPAATRVVEASGEAKSMPLHTAHCAHVLSGPGCRPRSHLLPVQLAGRVPVCVRV